MWLKEMLPIVFGVRLYCIVFDVGRDLERHEHLPPGDPDVEPTEDAPPDAVAEQRPLVDVAQPDHAQEAC